MEPYKNMSIKELVELLITVEQIKDNKDTKEKNPKDKN